ncbi:KAP family P-loop NTPase fold protein [Pararhizobium arenae]|uniref:KAP family P-loop NTPase fold protein n=1 Tax=Pararhizobium arenae TaxID=1856850 RepID=UPI00094A9F7E|nr:P-loop NTPase fold protein [Pararhizobium arenae]
MGESLKDIWADDKLSRRDDAEFLATFLRNKSDELTEANSAKSYVLNLDAGWGRGKTFFLDRLRRQLIAAGHLAVYVNAWQDDFADDPLVAVMAGIDSEVASHLKPRSAAAKAWDVTKATGGKVVGLVAKGLALRGMSLLLTSTVTTAIEGAITSGYAAVSERESLEKVGSSLTDEASLAIERTLNEQAERSVSDFLSYKETIRSFKGNLSKFVLEMEAADGKARPFFILVDELDRCRPPYAIAMLERIKHLFDTPHLVFVVATDSGQLQHAIRAVYGADFDSRKYLKRFFDSSFVFEKPSILEFVTALHAANPIDASKVSAPYEIELLEFLSRFYTQTDADLRSVEQMYMTLETIVSAWSSKARIELIVLLPLIYAFYRDQESISENEDISEALKIPTLPTWTITTHERLADSFNSKKVEKAIPPLAINLWALAQTDLLSLMRQNRSGDWVHDRMLDELHRRFGGTISSSRLQYSLVRSYPKLVRQAGRLSMAD